MVALAYAPTLWNGLVWDDLPSIAENPRLRTIGAATAYLFGAEGAYYRPLVFLAYAGEQAVWGTAAFGYHLTNLLLHLSNVLLLRVLARRSGVCEVAALLGAAVFALHPVQTDAVAYVSGRTDLLMTAGALLSCTALLGQGPALARGLGAAAAGAVAMLSKESGYALVVLWPWLAWRHASRGRERLALVAPGVAAALMLLALRPAALPEAAPAISLTRLAAVGQALVTYGHVLAWPIDLQIDRLTALPGSTDALAAGLLVLMAALALMGWGLAQRGAVGDWTAWTVAFYLPVANLLALYPGHRRPRAVHPRAQPVRTAGRRGRAGRIGAARAGAELAPVTRRAALAVTVLLLVFWAGRSAVRCVAWHDEEALFGAAVAAGSASPRVWYNYGNALLQHGAVAQAADVLEGAAQRAPGDAAIWTNLGVARSGCAPTTPPNAPTAAPPRSRRARRRSSRTWAPSTSRVASARLPAPPSALRCSSIHGVRYPNAPWQRSSAPPARPERRTTRVSVPCRRSSRSSRIPPCAPAVPTAAIA